MITTCFLSVFQLNPAARITKCTTSCSQGDFSQDRVTELLFKMLSVGDRVSEWKCIHLKALWMIISGHCAGSKQQRLDPAVQHFDTTLNALEPAVDLCKKNSHGIPLTFGIGEHKGGIYLMSEKIVQGICCCRGRVSKTSNQKWCLFSHACPCSQQSLSSQTLFQWGRWALPTLHLRAVNKLCWGVLMMSVWETK